MPAATSADVLDQHDARVGVGRLRRLVAVGVDVGAVVGAERVRALGDPGAQRVRVVGVRVVGDPERDALRVHQMVGARRADGDEPLGLDRGDELERPRGDVSTTSTLARSLDTAPRIAGSSSRSSARALGLARRGRGGGPPKRCASRVRSLTNATARLITSIVRRYASSALSPHTTSPCLASTTSLRSGFARAASPTCLESANPGRM